MWADCNTLLHLSGICIGYLETDFTFDTCFFTESPPLCEREAIPYLKKLDTAKALHSSTSLPSDIDPQQAGEAFRGQLEALTLLLQSNLLTITTKLYGKSIISSNARQEALNPNHTENVRTVSLLSVVENQITAEPHVFTELVKILESEPTLRSQAKGLVEKYLKIGMSTT